MSTNLYVGNLSFNTTSEDLQALFAPFGDVKSASIVMDADLTSPNGAKSACKSSEVVLNERFPTYRFVLIVILRTVAVWHITWSVNSLTHIWGYRNYPTGDESKNNWLVGIVSNGEGWHNNHHAEPRSVAHGHYWWEFDLSYRLIHLFESVGLAWKVVRPANHRPSIPVPEPIAEPISEPPVEQKKRAA